MRKVAELDVDNVLTGIAQIDGELFGVVIRTYERVIAVLFLFGKLLRAFFIGFLEGIEVHKVLGIMSYVGLDAVRHFADLALHAEVVSLSTAVLRALIEFHICFVSGVLELLVN